MTKFFIPPLSMLGGWFLAFLCARAGRATFLATRPLLALTLLTSLVSCAYVVLRLRARRKEAPVRQVLFLNVIAIVAFFVLLLLFAGRAFLP